VDKMLTDIFKKLSFTREALASRKVKTTTLEVKISDSLSRFYISILINPDYLINDECDEIVIEITSKDNVIFHLDVSDSLGNVYAEMSDISEFVCITEFIDNSLEIVKRVLVSMTKS
jgi:hypothetical protein